MTLTLFDKGYTVEQITIAVILGTVDLDDRGHWVIVGEEPEGTEQHVFEQTTTPTTTTTPATAATPTGTASDGDGVYVGSFDPSKLSETYRDVTRNTVEIRLGEEGSASLTGTIDMEFPFTAGGELVCWVPATAEYAGTLTTVDGLAFHGKITATLVAHDWSGCEGSEENTPGTFGQGEAEAQARLSGDVIEGDIRAQGEGLPFRATRA